MIWLKNKQKPVKTNGLFLFNYFITKQRVKEAGPPIGGPVPKDQRGHPPCHPERSRGKVNAESREGTLG